MVTPQRTPEVDGKASLFSSSSNTSDLESDGEDTAFLLKSATDQRRNKSISRLNVALLCFNLVIATISTISWMRSGVTAAGQYHFAYDHAPLSSIATTSPIYSGLTLGDRSPYTQPPSDAVDREWDKVSAPPGDVGLISVKSSELTRLNLSSIPMADGSGYSIGTIKVFHDLHCLDFLRKQIYNATHYKIPIDEYPLQEDHIAHCLDNLRRTLQCRPDLGLLTFKYIRDWPRPWADFRSTQTCVNFDNILSWAQERSFDSMYIDETGMKRSKLLLHPDKDMLLEKVQKGEVSIRKLIDQGLDYMSMEEISV